MYLDSPRYTMCQDLLSEGRLLAECANPLEMSRNVYKQLGIIVSVFVYQKQKVDRAFSRTVDL
jgi:hypothetical protein